MAFPADLFHDISPDDELVASHIAGQLLALTQHTTNISNALLLLDTCKTLITQSQSDRDHVMERMPERQVYMCWMIMAAREIAITVDDFYRSFTAAKSMIKTCASLRKKVNESALESARLRYEAEFPQHLHIRNAACHIVDYSMKPHLIMKNQAIGLTDETPLISSKNPTNAMLTANIVNDEIQYSGNGVLHKLKITQETLDKLVSITAEIYTALRPSVCQDGV